MYCPVYRGTNAKFGKKRLIVLARRTEYMEADYLREEHDLTDLLLLMINPSVRDSEKKSKDHF